MSADLIPYDLDELNALEKAVDGGRTSGAEEIVLGAYERLLATARKGLEDAERLGECVWKPDDDGVYETTCGQAWVFEDGTPKENHARFCPYCGRTLRDASTTRSGRPSSSGETT